MTTEEFDATKWRAGMTAEYKGRVFHIIACDFQERLVELDELQDGSECPAWVRCENITLKD